MVFSDKTVREVSEVSDSDMIFRINNSTVVILEHGFSENSDSIRSFII
jgi:uncharacterized protein (DUF169 family)